jgi:integrase
MAPVQRRKRPRGSVQQLPSGALRVSVYAGYDPVSGRRHYLREVVPPGPKAAAEAEKVLRRFAGQVDDRRNPRTSATVDQLLDRHLETLDVGRTTHRMYRKYLEKHVRPFIGRVKAGAVDADVLDSLYAELRRCRAHCDSKRGIDHRTPREHVCDERCRPHDCAPLSATTIRHIHFVLSGAFAKAVRWRWVSSNPVSLASPPAARKPEPDPPSAEQAALLLAETWRDPDWGTLVWLTMTTGARRGELCALQWRDIDLVNGAMVVRRSISQDGAHCEQKDPKSHQQRRVALDAETVAVLAEHHDRCRERAAALDLELESDAFVFSNDPDGGTHLVPSSVSQRYSRLARRLGLDTHLHSLRHYSATELIAAGVDVRTVAGRLGHGGGGVTTLRVYAAWLAESDQRAAPSLAARVPSRPPQLLPELRALSDPRTTVERLAVRLRGSIIDGTYPINSHLPPIKALATEHGVSVSTVKRAMDLLKRWGDLVGEPNHRPTVSGPGSRCDETVVVPQGRGERPADQSLGDADREQFWRVTLRGPDGTRYPSRMVRANLANPDSFRPHLLGIARIEVPGRADAGESWIGDFELEVADPGATDATTVTLRW